MVSREVEALLRFYSGRKLISVQDIKEFSNTYQNVKQFMIKREETASKEGE